MSQLLLLFQHCHYCFSPKPDITVTQTATMMTIYSYCQRCCATQTWKSQPYLTGRFPAGNILLSFAILCAGASAEKVLLVFKHMGLLLYHKPTYYYHQKHFLIPTIVRFWRKYLAQMIESLKNKEVVLAGDGRHDSMGHSAKHCTYSIFCCTVGLILHFVLVQVSIKLINCKTLQNVMEIKDGLEKMVPGLSGWSMIIKQNGKRTTNFLILPAGK